MAVWCIRFTAARSRPANGRLRQPFCFLSGRLLAFSAGWYQLAPALFGEGYSLATEFNGALTENPTLHVLILLLEVVPQALTPGKSAL